MHLITMRFAYQDPRLLGEILIALMKCIIKDIEDVARTPATSLGGNHSSAANPSGGHPQVIEGVCIVFFSQYSSIIFLILILNQVLCLF